MNDKMEKVVQELRKRFRGSIEFYDVPYTEQYKIEYCLNGLAYLCAREKIKYLAMPRICCGGNKKDWNTVKTMILDAFNNAYTKASESANTNDEEPEEIYIDFCYQ